MRELRHTFHLLSRNPLSLAGMSIILTFALIALFASVLAPVPEGHPDPYYMPCGVFPYP